MNCSVVRTCWTVRIVAILPLVLFVLPAFSGGSLTTENSDFSLSGFWSALARHYMANGQLTPKWFVLFVATVSVLFAFPLLAHKHRIPADPWGTWATFLSAMVITWMPVLASGALNPDESQQLANALTWRTHANYFALIDGGTHGPLITFPLMLPWWASGGRIALDYGLAHSIGLVLLALLTLPALLAAKAVGRERDMAVLITPVMAMLILLPFGQNLDFIAYNAHHMPMLLVAFAVYFGTTAAASQSRKTTALRAACAGALLSAVLLAKMQWAPVACVVGLGLTAAYWRLAPRRMCPPLTIALYSGVAINLVVMASVVFLSGHASDFFQRYVIGQIIYADLGGAIPGPPMPIWAILITQGATNGLFFILLILAAWSWHVGWRVSAKSDSIRGASAVFPVFSLAAFVVAFLAATVPGNYYSHYCFLLIFTGSGAYLLLGTVGSGYAEPRASKSLLWGAWLAAVAFLAIQIVNLVLAPSGINRITVASEPWKHSPFSATCGESARSRLSLLVRNNSMPGQPIAVWGWDYDLFVRVQRANATLTGASGALDSRFGDSRRHFDNFMAELNHARPAVLIDAITPVAFAYNDMVHQGALAYPPLRRWLEAGYRPERVGCYTVWISKPTRPAS